MPYIKKVGLSNLPGTAELRPDDAQLMNMLLAYPTPESYALTAAFVQAVLYLRAYGIFQDENQHTVPAIIPKHGFYSSN